MPFGDATTPRTVWDAELRIPITLAASVKAGDLLGYSSGWKQAIASSSAPIAAELVALECGASGETIMAARRAYVGDVSGGTAGAEVFLSSTAGGYASSPNGSVRQVVGVMATATTMLIDPVDPHGVLRGARSTDDTRAAYNRLYLATAAGSGEAMRAYTTVLNVAAATAHGAHISLGFGSSGSLTGQGIATRSTLHLPTTALPASNVTYAALQAEVYSDGDESDPSGNLLSFIRLVNDGGAGKADVDDDAAAIEFTGFTVGDGNMIATKAAAPAPNVTHSIRIRLPDGSAAYLYAGPTALTA